MTEGEIQVIVAEVLRRIREYSARVVDLTDVGSLPPDAWIELSEGRKVKVSDFISAARALNLIKSGESTPASDDKVYSSLKSDEIFLKIVDALGMYLRKDADDIDPNTATFGDLEVRKGARSDGILSEGGIIAEGDVTSGGQVHAARSILVGLASLIEETVERKILSTYGSVDSMVNGHGTFLTNKDRFQTTNIEARGSLTVMDLIINQLHAMEGDYYFSDVGAIERVVTIDENANSYRLYLKKDTETSIITLREGDILWSVANNLRSHKTTDASFYVHPSWMLANAIDQDHFFIDVTLYDDAQLGIEVGTTNFAPEAGFNLVRRGNASARLDSSKAERARVWHISNTEGRLEFLDYLYTPVVDDENYQTTVGRLPDIEVLNDWFHYRNLGEPHEHIGVYTRYLFAENFVHIDWMGRVVCQQNYRGEWNLATAQSQTDYYKVDKTRQRVDDEYIETAYLTDTVTWLGAMWGCNQTRTTQEPTWYSSHWLMVGGNNAWDIELHKGSGSVPTTRQETFQMEIYFRIIFNGFDVTDKVLAQDYHSVTWERTTDDEAKDRTWNTVGINLCYQDQTGTRLLLKHDPANHRTDFGDHIKTYRSAIFRATVLIPMATGENKTVTKTFNFI